MNTPATQLPLTPHGQRVSQVSPSSSPFRAVICDIDGCLGPESHEPMQAKALAQLAEHNLKAQKDRDRPILTLCSGRPQPFVEAMCRVVGNATLPCVAEMGVWLYDPSTNRFIIDPAITPTHMRAVREATVWIEQHLLPQGVVIQPGKTASISLWHPDTNFLMALKPKLVEQFAESQWPLRVSSTVAWINCDLAHISKATGIERMLALTGLHRQQLAGIGDTIGDMAIRESVAFFACPSNAQEELKKHANYISNLHEIAGVLDILHHLPVHSPGSS